MAFLPQLHPDVKYVHVGTIYVSFTGKLCKEQGIAINKLTTMNDVMQSTLDNIVRGLTKKPRVKNAAQDRTGVQYDAGRIFGF